MQKLWRFLLLPSINKWLTNQISACRNNLRRLETRGPRRSEVRLLASDERGVDALSPRCSHPCFRPTRRKNFHRETMATDSVTSIGDGEVTSSVSFTTWYPFLDSVDLTIPKYLRVAYVIIGLVGVAGNTCVCAVLVKYRSKSRVSVTEGLLIHQTVVDLVTSLLVIVTATFPPPHTYSMPPSQWDLFVCRFWATQVSSHWIMQFVLYQVSHGLMNAVTVDSWVEVFTANCSV